MDVPSALVLPVDPADTDGRLLRLHTTPTAHPAVATTTVAIGALRVQLAILAASHRVLVTGPGQEEVWETVACDVDPATATATAHQTAAGGAGRMAGGADGASAPAGSACHEPPLLPSARRWSAGAFTVDFGARLVEGQDAVETAAAEVAALAGRPRSLVGRFPGHPHALTALDVEPDPSPDASVGLRWRSWHLYPGTQPHVVTTMTRLSTQECRR